MEAAMSDPAPQLLEIGSGRGPLAIVRLVDTPR